MTAATTVVLRIAEMQDVDDIGVSWIAMMILRGPGTVLMSGRRELKMINCWMRIGGLLIYMSARNENLNALRRS